MSFTNPALVPPSGTSVMTPARPLGAIDVMRVLLRHRRLLMLVPLLVASGVVAAGLLAKRSWTSGAALVAHAPSGSASRLAGLAAQFGVAVPGGQSGQSPDFYADVLRSDGMLRRLLAAAYTTVDGRAADLAARLVPGEYDAPVRQEFALRELRNRVSATTGLKTGIIRVSVKLDDPELARQVVDRAIRETNALNIAAQQSMAAEERRFTDERLALARTELRQAEDRLESFLRGNRLISGGPGLILQEERLRRDVSLRQQVMIGLAQGLEQSRLEEVRNVPLLGVVEAPVRAALPDSRKLALKAIFAFTSTAFLVGALLLVGEWRRRFAALRPDAAAEVELLAREAAADLARPWRLFARAPRRAA